MPQVTQHRALYGGAEPVDVPPLPHEPQIGTDEEVVPGEGALVECGKARDLLALRSGRAG